MCLEPNSTNISHNHHFQNAQNFDLCTTHNPPCKLYKTEENLGIPVSLIWAHLSCHVSKVKLVNHGATLTRTPPEELHTEDEQEFLDDISCFGLHDRN